MFAPLAWPIARPGLNPLEARLDSDKDRAWRAQAETCLNPLEARLDSDSKRITRKLKRSRSLNPLEARLDSDSHSKELNSAPACLNPLEARLDSDKIWRTTSRTAKTVLILLKRGLIRTIRRAQQELCQHVLILLKRGLIRTAGFPTADLIKYYNTVLQENQIENRKTGKKIQIRWKTGQIRIGNFQNDNGLWFLQKKTRSKPEKRKEKIL